MLLLVGARELGEKQRRAWPSPEVRDSTVTMLILLVQDGVPTCLPACLPACLHVVLLGTGLLQEP